MSESIVIVGAGGHATVVADALLAGRERVLGFTDADPARHGRVLLGLPILGGDAVLDHGEFRDARLANGIGGTRGERARRRVQERLQLAGRAFRCVVHPTAIVSTWATIGSGVQIMAGAIVQAAAVLGEGCIVNTGSIVEHDVVLDAFVHVAPGAVICGNASIGADSHVGAGAVIRQGITLGPGSIVGAGAVVVRDHPGSAVLVGAPARPVAANVT